MWFLTFDDIKWYFSEAWVLTEIAEKYFQGNFCDQWSIGTDYEKFLSNSVDLMKKLSERAVVQYLSISAIAWHWRRRRRWRRWRRRRRLHVHRGLYGSAVAAITSPAMAPRRRQWWRLDTVFLRALDAVRHSLAKRPGGHFFAFISVHLLRRGGGTPPPPPPSPQPRSSLTQSTIFSCLPWPRRPTN